MATEQEQATKKYVKSFEEQNATTITLPPRTFSEERHPIGTIETYGWYYDNQLLSPTTSMRLYSNMNASWNEEKGIIEFTKITGGKENNNYTNLIASSLLKEDFSFNISNNWVDNNIVDTLGQGLSGAMHAIQPYTGVFHKTVQKLASIPRPDLKKTDENGKEKEAKVTGKLLDMIDYFGKEDRNGFKAVESIRHFARGNFVTQGPSFTYFGGTTVDLGQFMMRFTILPNWDEEYKWWSVTDQLATILPYVMGQMEELPWDDLKPVFQVVQDGVGAVSENMSDLIGKLLDKTAEVTDKANITEVIGNYVKWMDAPAGYDINSLTNTDATDFPGTLCLRIGEKYEIPNLVVAGMQISLSKYSVKNPEYFKVFERHNSKDDTDGALSREKSSTIVLEEDLIDPGTGEVLHEAGNFTGYYDQYLDLDNQFNYKAERALSPLSCDVTLTLRPVSRHTTATVLRAIEGNPIYKRTTLVESLSRLGLIANQSAAKYTQYNPEEEKKALEEKAKEDLKAIVDLIIKHINS